MAIRAVFFDLDDTLCDAKQAFARASEAAFDTLLARHSHLERGDVWAQWRAIHLPLFAELAAGRLSMAAVRQRRFRDLLTALGVPEDAWADALDRELGERQLRELRLYDDVAVLEHLREQGLHVGIITNGAGDSHPDSQRSKAAHLGLIERVDSFWVSDEIGHRKPDPRAFLPALAAAGIAPGEALFVGDSVDNDIVGANRVGMGSVLLWRGATPVPALPAAATPRYTITSLARISGMLATGV